MFKAHNTHGRRRRSTVVAVLGTKRSRTHDERTLRHNSSRQCKNRDMHALKSSPKVIRVWVHPRREPTHQTRECSTEELIDPPRRTPWILDFFSSSSSLKFDVIGIIDASPQRRVSCVDFASKTSNAPGSGLTTFSLRLSMSKTFQKKDAT